MLATEDDFLISAANPHMLWRGCNCVPCGISIKTLSRLWARPADFY